MHPPVMTFDYNGFPIEFSLQENVMINATEMAKIFGKNVANYLRNDETKRFLNACLLNANSHLINVTSYQDLVITRKKSGTWFHRIVALEFAAWLDPSFKLWVYATIETLLYGSVREAMEKARRVAQNSTRISTLKSALLSESEYYREIVELERENSKLSKLASKGIRNQLSMFN